jgi:hypothetical protein
MFATLLFSASDPLNTGRPPFACSWAQHPMTEMPLSFRSLADIPLQMTANRALRHSSVRGNVFPLINLGIESGLIRQPPL